MSEAVLYVFLSMFSVTPSTQTLIKEAIWEHSQYEDLEYVVAVVAAESTFNPLAVSEAGASGLMQLTPIAIEEVVKNSLCGIDIYPGNIYDMKINVRIGSCFLAHLVNLYKGNRVEALAHYNGGTSAVKALRKGLPYRETANYITRISYYLELIKQLKGRQHD